MIRINMRTAGALLAAIGLAGVAVSTTATAQSYSGYDSRYADVAPQGYDGRDLPPPPPGWTRSNESYSQQAADARYARDAENWARDNCTRSSSNTGVGAALGGVIGAVLGNSIAGRGDRTAGTIVGGVVGAAGGAAIGSTTGGATSPGCPPGYTMRNGVRPYEYSASGYTYAAPSWYRPWVNSDNSWRYRPYPYSNYYYKTYVARDYRDGQSYGENRDGQSYRDNRDDRGSGYDNDRSSDRRPTGWYDRYGRYHDRDGSYYDRNGVFHMGR